MGENAPGSKRDNNRRYCSYKGCSSDLYKTRNGAITFFGFPVKDTERCSVWISNSGREEFRYLTPKELAEKKICELHFDFVMFSNQFRTNLTKKAIPMQWQNPETIQIDDDEPSTECNSDRSPLTSSNNSNEVHAISTSTTNAPVGEQLRALRISNDEVLQNSSLTGKNTCKSIDSNASNVQKKNVNKNIDASNGNLVEESFSNSKSFSTGKQSTIITSTSNSNNRHKYQMEQLQKQLEKKIKPTKKPAPTLNKKTKFHNLASQTPPNDFYYQQCPTIEETNHSFSEPPDGELPLFVQQNSVISLVDEPANSVSSDHITKKRKLDVDNEDLAAQMRDAMKHLKNITSLLTNNDDEFELFGKSVALQLKKMTICTALSAQAKIQDLLSQHRITDIKKNDKNLTNTKICDNLASNGTHCRTNHVQKKRRLEEPETTEADREEPEESNSLEDEEKEKEDEIDASEEIEANETEENDSTKTPTSPQLSLTCASETSDVEETT